MDMFFDEEVIKQEENEIIKLNESINSNIQKYEEKLNYRPKRELNINLNPKNEIKEEKNIIIDDSLNIKKRNIIFENKPKKTEPISPIFGPSQQKEKTITANRPSNHHTLKASKNSGVISPFHGIVKDEEMLLNKNEINIDNPYGVIEEIKSIDVKDVEQTNEYHLDFLDEVIDSQEERIVVSRDISLFD